ncbi:GntR family transcriptional regulator [Pseudonocardia nigra]|uniref:GntR family transcriptional regulator n=1 Tax=Pseudonocardia nigra TaxID=1921578 RepID=UPI001C5F18AB|nr:GntR family transcriptional regulator [Pseudonocardia nigra]
MTAVDPASDALASLGRARHLIARTTTAERVADAVREEVAEGRLLPGARLPEQALCAALGVSRNTVREALSQLVSERVLVREHNRGVFVAEPDRDIVRDVYRARRILEPAAVRHGEAFDEAGVALVRAAVTEGMAAAADDRWDDVGSANQHFHRALVALAGSARLDQQMALLLAEMRLVFHRMPDVREFFEPYVARNDVIAGLIEAGDREAAAVEITDYLHAAEKQLLAAYEQL